MEKVEIGSGIQGESEIVAKNQEIHRNARAIQEWN